MSLLEAMLSPTPMTLLVAVLLIVLTPLVLHLALYRNRATSRSLPTFLVVGPLSSGKTTLMTGFASSSSELPALKGATAIETRTSQEPQSLDCHIPASLAASHKYRSTNDPSLLASVIRFTLHDTPGHGKLRPHATELITAETRGVVFVLDAAASQQHWRDAAEYLYTVLLRIQHLLDAPGSRQREGFPVLVACNKSDLFTALPPAKICTLLEAELNAVREARSRGIVRVGLEDSDEVVDLLGTSGKRFSFAGLEEEVGIAVSFRGGSTRGDGWRLPLGEWVGGCL